MRLSHGTALFATVGILAAGHIACSGSADEGPAERPKSQEQGERPVSQYYQEEVKPDIVWKAAEGTFGASLSLDGSAVVTA
ncbi:MAG: hypothetical protein IH851_05225, partial [Armatimonadetes bacterium]|nr:hypothetical protein [Armatimonadota bacterium]